MFLIETFARLPAQASSCNSSHSPQQCGIGEAARAALEVREARRTARLAERAEREASEVSTASERTALANGLTLPQKRATTAAPNLPRPNPAAAAFRQNYRDEAKVRIEAALNAEIGFAERLTWFWSNHFCISAAKNGVRLLAGAYEREAIRPNVLGRFADILLAAETHPAMLIYLDNARSIGPNSQAGRDRGKGLNENLAREILELHTLGVRTVYTQDDVTRFAKIITGWTVIPPREEHGGEFRFNPHMHEPGAQTLIGRPFADALVTIEPGGRIADERNTGGDKAFAVGPIAPLVVRGPAPVLSWTPPRLEPTTDDTLMRLLELYRHTDVSMARALEERIGLAAIARAGGIDAMPKNAQPAGAAQVRAYFAESAGSAAKFIARPDGPRVGALAFNGLGHPRQRGRSERPPRGLAGSARRGHRGGQKRHGSGLARHRHCRGDGIRAHGPY
jgi:hypothetical protein